LILIVFLTFQRIKPIFKSKERVCSCSQ